MAKNGCGLTWARAARAMVHPHPFSGHIRGLMSFRPYELFSIMSFLTYWNFVPLNSAIRSKIVYIVYFSPNYLFVVETKPTRNKTKVKYQKSKSKKRIFGYFKRKKKTRKELHFNLMVAFQFFFRPIKLHEKSQFIIYVRQFYIILFDFN